MPHTNSRTSTATKRKASKPIHTKRIILDDDSGWSHVVGGKTHGSKTVRNLKTAKGDFSIGQFHYVHKTLEELQKEYESSKRSWEKSSACGELKRLVKGEGKDRRPRIGNVVVFGLGTFQAVEAQHSRTSLTQLAALHTILENLGGEISVVQQDPAYTPLDKEFLDTFKHTVCDDPEGYKRVDERSLVYAIHCYPDVYDGVRKVATPAMLIGNNLKGEEPTPFNNLEAFGELQSLYEGLEVKSAMPQFGNAFSSTVVFTRRDESKQEEEKAEKVKADEVAALAEKLEI